MPTTIRLYGKVVEVTEYEKTSAKAVRIHAPRARGDVIGCRRVDSLRRTKQICVRKLSTAIEELGSPLLLTLTFDGDASDAYSSSKALALFFRRLRLKYPRAHALVVPEVSPKGRIHFHGLLFGLPQSLGDVRKGGRTIYVGSERGDRELAAIWKAGYLDCRQTDGSPKLAYYLTKYILKHNDNNFNVLLNGLRMVRTTMGFPSELVLRGNDFGTDFVHRKYADKTPISSWVGHTRFTGRISKIKYLRE